MGKVEDPGFRMNVHEEHSSRYGQGMKFPIELQPKTGDYGGFQGIGWPKKGGQKEKERRAREGGTKRESQK